MRKSWIGFGAVAGIAGAVAVVPYFVDWNWFKPYLVSAVEDATGYQVKVAGKVDFALFPTPRLSAQGLTVRGFGASKTPLLTADKLSAAVAFLPLLSKKVDVRYIVLEQPSVRLVSYAGGGNNWRKPGGSADTGKLSIDDFRIDRGTFVRVDANGRPFRLDDVTATLNIASAGGPYAFDGSLRYGETPLTLKASYKPGGGVALDADIDTAGSVGFRGRVGRASGKDATPVVGRLSVKADAFGDLLAAFSRDKNAAQPAAYQRPLSLVSVVQGTTRRIHLSDLAGKLGDSNFSADLTVALAEATEIQGRFAVDQLNFMDFSSTGASEKPFQLPGDMTADVLFRVVNAEYGNADFGAVNAPLKLADAILSLGKTRIDLPGGGTATVAGRLNAVAGKPRFRGKVSTEMPRAAATLAAFGIDDYSLLPALTATGDVLYAGDVLTLSDAKGTADGKAFALQARYPFKAAAPVDMTAAAQSLDMARIVQRDNAVDKNENPHPIRFNIRLGELIDAGRRYVGIAATGTYASGRVQLGQATVRDAFGYAVAAKGTVDKLSGERRADLMLSLVSPNMKGSLTVKGPASKMDVGGAVTYAGAQIGLNGWVQTDPGIAYQLAATAKAPEAGAVLAKLRDAAQTARIGPLDLGMRIEGKGDVARISGLAGKIGGMNLSGDATVNTAGDVPVVNGKFIAGAIPLTALVGGNDTGAAQATANGRRWSRAPLSFDWIRRFDGQVTVTGTRATYEPYVLEAPSLAITSRGGTLSIDALKAGLYGGQLAVSGTLRAGTPQSMELDVALSGVPVEPLLTSAGASAPATGTLDFTGKFTAHGQSQDQLMHSLDGPVRVAATDGVIRKFDLKKLDSQLGDLRTVNSFVQFAVAALKGGTTQYRTLAADLAGSGGRFTISKLVTDLDGGNAVAKGYVDVGDWNVDIDAVLTLGSHHDAPAIPASIQGSLPTPQVSYNLDPLKLWFGKRLALAGINAAVKGEGLDLGGLLGAGKPKAPGINPGAPTPDAAAANSAGDTAAEAPKKSVEQDLGGAIAEGIGKLFGKKKPPARPNPPAQEPQPN